MKSGRARPVWNVISLSAPFWGFVGGVIAGISAPHMQYGEWGFRVWLAFALAGLFSGVIALVRAERLWGLTLAGLLLNTVLLWFINWKTGGILELARLV